MIWVKGYRVEVNGETKAVKKDMFFTSWSGLKAYRSIIASAYEVRLGNVLFTYEESTLKLDVEELNKKL